ncbi:hypothetical protein HDE76_003779 [Rhodanobacter sp. ANJX3]|uniref:DUF6348 family protein n=1 Tax=unclassified Rhodanobacter TaxID=2621553 RepID=UPI0015CC5FBE|nr:MULTISPECIES: DUF6348 family protein [unclassified Rhodanobacter]MBB5360535.1 hypothetical protein [Rhodanobacter sp. ANJX3]NYE30264.1 hypothetical protein [Rhodanobacter sp. K2T2]
MDSAALQKYLLRLFERHDVELEEDEEDWLVTDGDFPAIRASWTPATADAPGRLDIDIVISEERRIEESFAGFGDGDAACRDALKAFEQNTFHLVLAACWYVTDDRRMQITAWDIGVRTWDVFIGPFTVRGVDDAVAMPPEAMASIETALKRESLTPELHWVRVIHRRDSHGEGRTDVLLDNEPWPTGVQALSGVDWPAVGDYTASAFVMLDVRDY